MSKVNTLQLIRDEDLLKPLPNKHKRYLRPVALKFVFSYPQP